MSQDQQFLSPQQQDTLFQKLKEAGLLSQDVGQSPSAPDEQAQSGVGNIDFNTLQSLLKHASNPNAVPMQEGDKLHPMDAIQQIGQQMQGPQAPNGVSLATGPQLSQGPNGLRAQVPGRSPIGKLLGMVGVKQNIPVNGPNYFQAAKQAGIDKFLPSGLAQMPDGSPFVGPETFSKALVAQRTTAGQGNQTYTSKEQLISQGIPEDAANGLMAANPNGVTAKEISNYLGSERIKSSQQMADARSTMAGVAKMGQILKVGGFDAAQTAAESAVKNLGNAQRAQAAIDQITANGGMANQRQRTELAASIAQISSNSSGVLTDEKLKQFLPASAKGKFGNVLEYWTNENQPVDFTGFLPQLQDLLTREKQANQGIFTGAQQLGINLYGTQNPKAVPLLNKNMATNPLTGNAPPPSNGAWKVIR